MTTSFSLGDPATLPPTTDDNIGTVEVADLSVLERILCRPRTKSVLEQFCERMDVTIEVRWADGTVLCLTGSPCQENDATRSWTTIPIYHNSDPVAMIAICGETEQVQGGALLVARWVEDLLSLEDEISSLTQEVVHSYDELHLLYSVGEVLNGTLDVVDACRKVVQAVLGPLNAASARIMLGKGDGEEMVAQALAPQDTSEGSHSATSIETRLEVNYSSLGRIIIEGKVGRHDFSSDDIKLLEGVAGVVAPAIHNMQLYAQARLQAATDSLTGLYNHRYLHERMEEELRHARRADWPLTILLIDLDNFKLFNDVHGHLIGDQVLKTAAACLQRSVRARDCVGRYGGDEFLIVLPESDARAGVEVAKRILGEMAKCTIRVKGEAMPISLSIGVASFPKHGGSKDQLIAHADSGLYESKRNGGHGVHEAQIIENDWLAARGNTFSVLDGLVQAVDAKDHYTHQHSEMVMTATLLLAEQLKLSQNTLRALRIAALLHDVGKIGIPDHVLKKPGKLDSEEREIMQQHVHLSEMIIKGVPHLNDVLDAVSHHHERYDGSGYPYAKQGEGIPLLGRIMAIADAYSAMCIDRPYRKRLSWEEIKSELIQGAGTQFDPELVPLFIDAMEEHSPVGHATSGSDHG